MRHESLVPELNGTRLARTVAGILTIAAMTLLMANVGTGQGGNHDAVANDLNNLARKAQEYYKTQGNSSFAGFALDASDTGNANGSYSIYDGGTPPVGSGYIPGSTAAASLASAQMLYIVGCGKAKGKDGMNPIKVYATVTPAGVTLTDLN
jgi:hypothetical protein